MQKLQNRSAQYKRLTALGDKAKRLTQADQDSVEFGLVWTNPKMPLSGKLLFIVKATDQGQKLDFLSTWEPTCEYLALRHCTTKSNPRLLGPDGVAKLAHAFFDVDEDMDAVLEFLHPSVKSLINFYAKLRATAKEVEVCKALCWEACKWKL